MNQQQILSAKQSTKDLAIFLDTFPDQIGMTKTTFEKLLAETIPCSPSSIHDILLNKHIRESWYNLEEDKNKLYALKEGAVQKIDQYMMNPENKISEENRQKWNDSRKAFSAYMEIYYTFIMLPAMVERYQEQVADGFMDKWMLTCFLQTDWEKANLKNEEALRSVLLQVTRYLNSQTEIQKMMISEEEMNSLTSIVDLLLSVKVDNS